VIEFEIEPFQQAHRARTFRVYDVVIRVPVADHCAFCCCLWNLEVIIETITHELTLAAKSWVKSLNAKETLLSGWSRTCQSMLFVFAILTWEPHGFTLF
jgi:hypothetical protein